MFDRFAKPYADFVFNAIGKHVAALGITANHITITGLLIGLQIIPAIAFHYYKVALAILVFNRIMDGLDGAVARATKMTPLGGFLDIVCDCMLMYCTSSDVCSYILSICCARICMRRYFQPTRSGLLHLVHV